MGQEKTNPQKEDKSKPKSSVNKSFRKHNKLGFYRLMQRKKKNSEGSGLKVETTN